MAYGKQLGDFLGEFIKLFPKDSEEIAEEFFGFLDTTESSDKPRHEDVMKCPEAFIIKEAIKLHSRYNTGASEHGHDEKYQRLLWLYARLYDQVINDEDDLQGAVELRFNIFATQSSETVTFQRQPIIPGTVVTSRRAVKSRSFVIGTGGKVDCRLIDSDHVIATYNKDGKILQCVWRVVAVSGTNNALGVRGDFWWKGLDIEDGALSDKFYTRSQSLADNPQGIIVNLEDLLETSQPVRLGDVELYAKFSRMDDIVFTLRVDLPPEIFNKGFSPAIGTTDGTRKSTPLGIPAQSSLWPQKVRDFLNTFGEANQRGSATLGGFFFIVKAKLSDSKTEHWLAWTSCVSIGLLRNRIETN